MLALTKLKYVSFLEDGPFSMPALIRFTREVLFVDESPKLDAPIGLRRELGMICPLVLLPALREVRERPSLDILCDGEAVLFRTRPAVSAP